LRDEGTAAAVARALAEPLLAPGVVRAVRVKLSRLGPASSAQRSLLPPGPGPGSAARRLEFGA
ncbi:MAG TPA: hypothetical protein VFO85_00040, partial [Vicinamibacteria bacterium]|nr:hypothetical protein [Vicinamibacteria bacterium]